MANLMFDFRDDGKPFKRAGPQDAERWGDNLTRFRNKVTPPSERECCDNSTDYCKTYKAALKNEEERRKKYNDRLFPHCNNHAGAYIKLIRVADYKENKHIYTWIYAEDYYEFQRSLNGSITTVSRQATFCSEYCLRDYFKRNMDEDWKLVDHIPGYLFKT